MRALLASLLIVPSVTACMSTNVTHLNPTAARQPTCPEAVVIYSGQPAAPSEYSEVGLLNTTASTVIDENYMYEDMRKKAAAAGANGLILGGVDEPSAGAKVAAAVFLHPLDRKGRALAVWVPKDSARTDEICNLTRSFVEKGETWTVQQRFRQGRSELVFRTESGNERVMAKAPKDWRNADDEQLSKWLRRHAVWTRKAQ